MEHKNISIVNRRCYNTLESNLVYPQDCGWYYTAQLDEVWLLKKLHVMGFERINNKYCVSIPVSDGSNIYVTNHDEKYYLTVPGENAWIYGDSCNKTYINK